MTENLNIALVQTHLAWENPVQNRSHLEQFFTDLNTETDIILLPEMFTTGFTMQPEPVADTMHGTTVSWMKEWAAKKEVAIGGSVIIQDGESYYNRFLFVTPAGEVHYYDKRHRFMMAGEGNHYTAGKLPILLDYKGWKLFPQICYDLRFPVYSRNSQEYDVLIYVANWPKTRIAAWDTLLKARAIENMSYCVGVNRIGLDGNNLEYIGHSAVYDLLGNTLAFGAEKETILYASLSKNNLNKTRAKLPFLEDRDNFELDY